MANKEKNFMSAVIYVHNDETVIDGFLQAVIGVLEDNFEHSEIICVNDFSQDDSAQVVRQTGRQAHSGYCPEHELFPRSGDRHECRRGLGDRGFCAGI